MKRLQRFTRFLKAPIAWPLGLAVLVAVAMPAAFLQSQQSLRTPPGVLWLTGAGVILGWITYYNRRAAPYLLDRPSSWALGRKIVQLNPSRYAEAGRRFVYKQIFGIVGFAIWWITVGPLLLFR